MNARFFSADARRLRAARSAIRRAERAVQRRRRIDAHPGYAELAHPVFVLVMLLAVAVLMVDVGGAAGDSVLVAWFRAVVAAIGGHA